MDINLLITFLGTLTLGFVQGIVVGLLLAFVGNKLVSRKRS